MAIIYYKIINHHTIRLIIKWDTVSDNSELTSISTGQNSTTTSSKPSTGALYQLSYSTVSQPINRDTLLTQEKINKKMSLLFLNDGPNAVID